MHSNTLKCDRILRRFSLALDAMDIPTEKNAQLQLVLNLCKTHFHDKALTDDVEAQDLVGFIELAPRKVPDMRPYIYLDPEGLLVGRAFELASKGYLVPRVISRWGASNFGFRLTSLGQILVADQARLEGEFPTSSGNFAFVIMSFSDNPELEDAYKLGIKPSIESNGLTCIRVDEIEHNRRVTDKVMECIRNCRVVVADLTEQRPNCYYELGYAHALGKEVVHTVKYGEMIHFDIQDYNFIIYPNTTELKTRLEQRLKAVI